ncbi:TIGR03618 family F420-dependent PPOX class oxidoreductase [Winogradskya consettensis]|uniref:TIGR03618 family F420-dependent PPOX class oxidoreductase n=1 Tax=Winogradskya consettensis TaxID=113560 RepID=UPI001BB3FED4|nr:TIGR03618 family F420-dependent PPOX class oxidoreductase [Actinoplanes consettensis]
MRELRDRPEFAVLSTSGPDGVAQLSVMWVGWDGDELVMATKGCRRKVADVRRDPRVTVLVHDRDRPARFVELRGPAQVTEEDARSLVDTRAQRYTRKDHVRGGVAEEADRVVPRGTPSRLPRGGSGGGDSGTGRGPSRCVAWVPATDRLVVEGVGCGADVLTAYRSGLIWIEAPDEVRRERAMARDGDTYAPHWERWVRHEDAFYAANDVRGQADLIIQNG